MNCIPLQVKISEDSEISESSPFTFQWTRDENEYASLGRTVSCLRVETIPLFVSTFYSSLDDIEDIGYSK